LGTIHQRDRHTDSHVAIANAAPTHCVGRQNAVLKKSMLDMNCRQSPNGHDFVENAKHKLWLKVALDAIEITHGQSALSDSLLFLLTYFLLIVVQH